MMDKPEVREFTRAAVKARMQVRLPSGVLLEGCARDVSLKGVLFITERSLPVGNTVKASLVLEAGEGEFRIDTQGLVVRVVEGGVAIEFTRIDSEGVELLRNLVLYNARDVDQAEREFDAHIGLKPRSGV
jgi:hypothetical protein